MMSKEDSRINSNASKRSVTSYARQLWISRNVPYEIIHNGTVDFTAGINILHRKFK